MRVCFPSWEDSEGEKRRIRRRCTSKGPSERLRHVWRFVFRIDFHASPPMLGVGVELGPEKLITRENTEVSW